MPTAPLQVAIVAYSPLVRLGLRALLEPSAHRALVVDLAARDGHLGHHDVAIYDLAGLAHGTKDLRHLVATNTAVVGLLPWNGEDLARQAVSMRVAALVSPDISGEGLVEVIEAAAAPGAVPARRRTDGLHPGEVDGSPWQLTGREVDILTLIGRGLSNQEIAQQLYLSPNSVKTYIRSAYRKVGATTRSQAVLWVVQNGLDAQQRS